MQTKNQMTRSAMLMAILSCSQAVELRSQTEAEWFLSTASDILEGATDAVEAVSDGVDNILNKIGLPDNTLTLDDVIQFKQ